ncbi:MAG: hypothetical protein JW795_06190, partial [Chitinivibrionales bacterium]|nr:hypothetical protein [Chitinivibrionales bacterium]
MKRIPFFSPILFVIITKYSLFARPHVGEHFTLKQPDNAVVNVVVWGDEYDQVIESDDGYTLIRDSSGWICYATLCDDGSTYISTGITAIAGKPKDSIFSGKKHLRTLTPSHRTSEQLQRLHRADASPLMINRGFKEADSATIDTIIGLTICVDFPDEQAMISI